MNRREYPPISRSTYGLRCAANIANIIPVKLLGWKTPRPEASVRRFSLRLRIQSLRDVNIAKGDKMKNRTYIGYLVGYDSSNIFRIWEEFMTP